MDALTAVVSIAGSLLSGGGGMYAVQAIKGRRTAPADSAKVLTDAAMAQVDQLQERVHEAESAAKEARQEAEDARQQMRQVRREAADLAERMAMLARWIHDPGMDLVRLRALVPLSPGTNGR